MVMNGFDTNFDLANEVYAVNTVGFHYINEPIRVKRDELVRIYLVNVLEYDPVNSFHVHGNFFQYYPTGTSLTPSEFTDTVIQGQAQRGILEMEFPYDGDYMFHAHVSEFAELGWTGLLPRRRSVAPQPGRRRGRLLQAALGRGSRPDGGGSAGRARVSAAACRPGRWALIPLALIAVAIGAFALLGGPGLGERTGPPVEEVAVERTVLRPGEIELTLRNDGPDPVEVAQVAVNDAYAPFVAPGGREIGRLGSTTLRDLLPLDRGRGLRDLRPHLHRRHDRRLDPGRRRNPRSDVGFYGLMALLGIYVGVIPVSLGMLWLPFLRRLGRRWAAPDRLHRRPARLPGDRRRRSRALEIAGAAPAGLRRRQPRLRRRPRRLPRRWPGSTPTSRGAAGEAGAVGAARRRLPRAARGDRDRPPQPRRGPGDRLRLCERGAGARRLPRRRLRDPQHHRGPGDRGAAARRRQRDGPSSAACSASA